MTDHLFGLLYSVCYVLHSLLNPDSCDLTPKSSHLSSLERGHGKGQDGGVNGDGAEVVQGDGFVCVDGGTDPVDLERGLN